MTKILNSKGQPIELGDKESKRALMNQKMVNALGYEVEITTLTTILKSIIEQKFFEIAPADYIPVRVGEGAWSTSLETFRSFSVADDFSTGVINTGSNNSRLATADTGVDSVNIKVLNWAKEINYSLFDLEHASKSGNWDLVTAKESSRKKNWDLGVQRVAFLGLDDQPEVQGLLNLSGIENNTTRISKKISDMTASELSTFLQGILDDYRANAKRTAWPTHFVIPETDYLGLASPSDPNYPLKSKLDLILETMRVMTKNPNFQVLPCAYGDESDQFGGSGNIRYALYNSDPESLRMDVPVPYNSTLQNTINGFNYQNVGYGQFTGVQAYRPLEIIYFTH